MLLNKDDVHPNKENDTVHPCGKSGNEPGYTYIHDNALACVSSLVTTNDYFSLEDNLNLSLIFYFTLRLIYHMLKKRHHDIIQIIIHSYTEWGITVSNIS